MYDDRMKSSWREVVGGPGRFVGELILLYIVIFVVFSLIDHRFAFSWFHVELALAITLASEGAAALRNRKRTRNKSTISITN
jgi:hypothetical protein